MFFVVLLFSFRCVVCFTVSMIYGDQLFFFFLMIRRPPRSTLDRSSAASDVYKRQDEGADILDIGGESTRPGSQQVSTDEELKRIIPVLEALIATNTPISVDTSKPEVMKYAIAAGAFMINDVNALRSPGALETVAQNNHVRICLMHMQGTPQGMQINPEYNNIVSEVKDFLQQRIHAATTAGISKDRLIIDPGFGFGKTLQHNLTLLEQLDQLTTFGVPVLADVLPKTTS